MALDPAATTVTEFKPTLASGAPVVKPRLLFVTQFPLNDPAAWAGTQHFMLAALRANWDVSPLQVSPPIGVRALGRAGRAVGAASSMDFTRSGAVLDQYAREVERAVKRTHPAAIFSPSSIPLAHYTGQVPAYFWTDAVFSQLVGFYGGEFASVAAPALSRAVAQERSALEHLRSAYSSQWAIDEAKRVAPGSKPRLLGFGPNLPHESVSRVLGMRRSSPREPMRLLWLAGDWQRKGGPAALSLFRRLGAAGIPVRLDLVGARPESELPDGVTFHGRLSKQVPNELARLESLFATATFLVLPSSADCTPIVVSEAAAVGLPVLATDVGGLGETIERFDMGFVAESVSTFAETMVARLWNWTTPRSHNWNPTPMPQPNPSIIRPRSRRCLRSSAPRSEPQFPSGR